MEHPHRMVEDREEQITAYVDRARRTLGHLLDRAESELTHTHARVVALSPAATLQRGYAVLQKKQGGAVVRAADLCAVKKHVLEPPAFEITTEDFLGQFLATDIEDLRRECRTRAPEELEAVIADTRRREEALRERADAEGISMQEAARRAERRPSPPASPTDRPLASFRFPVGPGRRPG